MATYYVYSAAAGAANGSSWTDAYTTLQAALGVATAADTIHVAHDHDQTGGVWTFTFPATPGLRVLCVNRTTGDLATTAYVRAGSVTTVVVLDRCAYIYGISFVGGTSAGATANLSVCGTVATSIQHLWLESCGLELPNSNTGVRIIIGPGRSSTMYEAGVTLVNCRLKFGSTSHMANFGSCRVEIIGLTIDASGSTPTTLFNPNMGVGGEVTVLASDLTTVSWTNLINANANAGPRRLHFHQCDFPTGWSAWTGTWTAAAGSTELLITECGSGDDQSEYRFYNGLGSVVYESTIKLTASEAGASWKIVTNSSATKSHPFMTPWLPGYATAGAGAVRYAEILRDGSATAFQDDTVWAEFLAKTTSGSTLAAYSTGRRVPLGTAADLSAGAGLGAWSGESGTAWSGKVESPSITLAEAGDLTFRVGVSAASTTVYVDPVLR